MDRIFWKYRNGKIMKLYTKENLYLEYEINAI